uniref:Uncharacterized protein n=1 Tax=Megaselia scalaris TaxID=36166 RepID=T1H4F1_MEGSC
MLVLNEPICPDQVANVSRDCMTAYIECEIMKKMKTTSSDQKLSATWKDIYLVRENIVISARL